MSDKASPTVDLVAMSELDSFDEDDFDMDGLSEIVRNENFDVDESHHRPVSPATPFESFFIPSSLQTTEISAFALASQIRSSRQNYSGHSATSVATDEFGTACENSQDINSHPGLNRANSRPSLFGKDVLIISREPIPEVSFESTDSFNMSSTLKYSKTTSTNPVKHYQFTDSVSEQPGHLDATQQVYEGAKGVWAWAKGVPVFKPFMGLAEGMTNKVIGVAGTSLQDIDDFVKPKLAELDANVINPTINNLVELITNAVHKGEDTIRPIIEAILGPLQRTRVTNGSGSTSKVEPAPEVTKPYVSVK